VKGLLKSLKWGFRNSSLISNQYKSRRSSVGIATRYGLDDRGSGVRFPTGLEVFLISTAPRSALGSSQPPIQWAPMAPSPVVKRPGYEADHLYTSGAEI
jgi:hypothetical protein